MNERAASLTPTAPIAHPARNDSSASLDRHDRWVYARLVAREVALLREQQEPLDERRRLGMRMRRWCRDP